MQGKLCRTVLAVLAVVGLLGLSTPPSVARAQGGLVR